MTLQSATQHRYEVAEQEQPGADAEGAAAVATPRAQLRYLIPAISANLLSCLPNKSWPSLELLVVPGGKKEGTIMRRH
jgi:hypothetical protein